MTLAHYDDSELCQLIVDINASSLIAEILRRGFQDLLEAKISALTASQPNERCSDQRSSHREGYRQPLLTTNHDLAIKGLM
jgi:hypothetical protein